MPRSGSGNYTLPPGTEGVPDTTIESGKYNAFIGDVATDLNTPRPIIVGGTGAPSAALARANLKAEVAAVQVTNYDSHSFETGSFYSMPGASGAPSANGISGTAVVFDSDPNYITLEARDIVTGIPYNRRKTAGTWAPTWSVEDPTGKVNRSGDTMTGALTLPAGNPTGLLHATHKQYVDEAIADAIAVWAIGLGSELRFTRSSSQHMTRLFNTISTQQYWTFSTWIKRVGLGTHQALFGVESAATGKIHIGFDTGNHLCFFGGAAGDIITAQGPVYADTSVWLNLVWTAGGITSGGPPLTTPKFHHVSVNNGGPMSALMNGNGINNAETHYIGQPSYYPDVVMKEIVFVDGAEVPPSSFGEDIFGVWTAKNYVGPFGANGFKLNFGSPIQLGRDVSGNNNNWTPVNFP